MARTKSGKLRPKACNGDSSIYQLKDGSFMGQVVIGKTPSGAYKYKRFKESTKSAVVRRINEFKQSVDNPQNTSEIYLGDYLKDYVEVVKKNKLKPASYDREYNVYKLINKHIGTFKLSQLTPELIEKVLINELIRENYSFSSVHKVIVLLNQCLNRAVRNGKIQHNVCKDIEQPSRKIFEQKDIRFFNDEEISKFISQAMAVYGTGKPRYAYGVPLILIIYTGLRGGELCALRWKDIDLDNKTITVTANTTIAYEHLPNGTKKRKAIEQNSTKTSSGRIIPLNKQSMSYIKMLMDSYKGEIYPDNYIVNNSQNIVTVERISQTYSNIANACEIERPLGVHTLRHTFASLMIRKGVDIKIVSEILGHKDVAFTYNVYVHLIDEQKAKAIGMLDLA